MGGVLLLVCELFGPVDFPIATDVTQGAAAFFQGWTQEQAAMTGGRVLLGAEHRCRPSLRHAYEYIYRLLEVVLCSHSVIVGLAIGVVHRLVSRLASERSAHELVVDVDPLEESGECTVIGERCEPGNGVRPDVYEELDAVFLQERREGLPIVVAVPDGVEVSSHERMLEIVPPLARS